MHDTGNRAPPGITVGMLHATAIAHAFGFQDGTQFMRGYAVGRVYTIVLAVIVLRVTGRAAGRNASSRPADRARPVTGLAAAMMSTWLHSQVLAGKARADLAAFHVSAKAGYM